MAAACQDRTLISPSVLLFFKEVSYLWFSLVVICYYCDGAVIYHEDEESEILESGVPYVGPRFKEHLMDSTLPPRKFQLLTKSYIRNIGDASRLEREDEVRIKATFEKDPIVWPLPVLLALTTFLVLSTSLAVIVILLWIRTGMSYGGGDSEEKEEEAWVARPAVVPHTTQQPPAGETVCMRSKAKGLLERRGSSASLTIDLAHPLCIENLTVTPTRECSTEEFLLSCSSPLSRESLKTSLKDVRALHREFWDLPLNHPDKVLVPGSSSKNRYKTVIPNEPTRVCLPVQESSDNLSGYINANYIRGYDSEEKAFIATQGPMTNTVADLWEMAWSEGAPALVMITRLWEKSRPKCEAYLPPDLASPLLFGTVHVTVDSLANKDGYTIRHITMQGKGCAYLEAAQARLVTVHLRRALGAMPLTTLPCSAGDCHSWSGAAYWLFAANLPSPARDRLSHYPPPVDPPDTQKNEETKKLVHFWFDSWPDHKTPPNAHSLLSLAKEVELARFGGVAQRRPSAVWLKESPSPVLTFGNLELKDDGLSTDTSPSKKRTKSNFTSSPDSFSTPDCFATPLDDGTAFRFSPSPTPEPEGVFWRFEKLSTNSTSSYDTAQLSGDSLSDRSPYRTNSSYDSPRSKAWTQSSGESSVWTEEGSPIGPSPPNLLSPRWLEDPGKRGRPLGPVIVHCSAGIGRTGCFIAICIGVCQLLSENSVDILSIVCKMRCDRGGMVQTAEQYEFIHRALALFERSLPGE